MKHVSDRGVSESGLIVHEALLGDKLG